ncbi:MAG: ribosomal protein S18-alanine N-acetyltransferase [Lachnospiraceae bacterium]|nr:ribosomal protein S18-alanine N-acetyltransferase [Lachnospiraceae bacterium]
MEQSHTIAEKEIIHYTIRKGTEADLPALAAIEKEVFGGEAWTAEMFRVYIDMPEAVFLVAEAAGKTADAAGNSGTAGNIAGYIVIETVAPEGFIYNVCVSPAYRRQGLARAMLLQAMDEARTQLNVNAFTLEARASNTAARALYESLGFVFAGIRPGYYSDPREDAATYWLR